MLPFTSVFFTWPLDFLYAIVWSFLPVPRLVGLVVKAAAYRLVGLVVKASAYRLVGLVVKASASRMADLGSIPAFALGLFPHVQSYQWLRI